MVTGGLACVTILSVSATWHLFGTTGDATPGRPKSGTPSHFNAAPHAETLRDAAAKNSMTRGEFKLVDDDGQTLWMSPTDGKPLDLGYLPLGVQIVVALRPKEFEDHVESAKVFSALGPALRQRAELLDKWLLKPPRGVTHLMIGVTASSDGQWQTALVAQLGAGPDAAEHLMTNLTDAIKKTHSGVEYHVANDLAYYAPAANKQLLVVAPAALVAEIIDLNGEAPPLRREVERLLSHTDAERHFTMILAPNFLFSEGSGVFHGQMESLREPLFWFLGDEFGASSLSVHWDDDFFVELLAVPTSDTSPQRAARILAERLAQIPDRLEEYVMSLETGSYGRRVVARFPAMVRKLAAYTRSGVDSDHAVLRSYLPAIAGHNLLMGAELLLAESVDIRRARPAIVEANAPLAAETVLSIGDRLQRPTSLAFPRDTLDAALEQLSRDIGIEIVIAGADLQAEGITKNQSFGIDMSKRPAAEVLVEILRQANPDKSASGPGDVRQKLVYVIASNPGKTGQILVTTRAAAEARGDQLPAVFQAE
jgi:hypothetical protein